MKNLDNGRNFKCILFMKKLFYILCGCALVVISCSKPNINEETICDINSSEQTFYASFNEEESRTLLNDNMKNTWCADDRISIFMGNTYNHHYKFDGATGDTKGTFSKVEDPFITGEILSANYAIYPYSNDNSIDDKGILHTSLPAIQNYEKGSFGLNANVMVAVTESLENRFLGFQNVCGYVRVNLFGEDVTLKSVTFAGNDNEVLAGTAQITAGYNQIPQLAMDGASEKVLTIECGDGVKIGATEYDATSFVFVVPPQVMKKGFTIVATDINGNTFTKISNNQQEVKRNTILSMPPLKWINDNSPKLEVPDGVLTIHNEEKGMLLVALMDYAYDEIVSMKVTGTMNDEDFLWIYYEMPALRYLDISDVNVTTLPNKSFYQSSNVETIIMPKTLQTIPDNVFYESVVKDVYLNDGLQTIGVSAFENCDNLMSLHIPQSVETIGAKAFYDCNKLEVLTFADGCKLTSLNSRVFSQTPIKSVQIPANVRTIATTSNSPFYRCKDLKTVTFEENSKLTILGRSFDRELSETLLETIEIPSSVTTIAESAFKGTPTLKNVYFETGSSLEIIQKSAFYGCTGIIAIQIPSSIKQIYCGAFASCSSLESLVFEENSNLIDLGIGIDSSYCFDKYTSYSTGVFADCTALQRVIIPASVNHIYARAFGNCIKLSSVEFEDNSQLKIIDGGYGEYSGQSFISLYSNGAFANCSQLETIKIPKTVATIGCGAFSGSGLTDVYFEENSQLEDIQGYVYYIKDSNGIVSYGRDPGSIGAFSGTKIESITLPANVNTIGDGAFAGCKLLKKISFETNSQLRSIGLRAFINCDLSSIKLPSTLTVIDTHAFYSNDNLKIINFDINSELQYINQGAFENCGAINYFYAQNVTQLKTIGRYAFSGCDDMRLFKLGTIECPKAYDSSFGEIGTYSVLKVPTESVGAYKAATGWKGFASITGLDE